MNEVSADGGIVGGHRWGQSDAAEVARSALEEPSVEPPRRADLLLDEGLAASYLGEIDRARQALFRADLE